MKTIILIAILAMVISIVPARAQKELVRNGVGIAAFCLVMPVGRVLLIERGSFLGGVKFIHNEQKADGIYSKYECFEFQNGRIKKIREGELLLKNPSKGKGFLFHSGPNSLFGPPLKIKDFTLSAAAGGLEHSTIYFESKPNKPDRKVRMAPTPWVELREINLSDPRIKWFAYDEKREWKVIPIDKIWD